MIPPAAVLPALRERFSAAFVAAFGAEHAQADPVLRWSDGKHGDLQANAAMGLSKALSQKSVDVAQAIAAHLNLDGWCDPPTVAGPGFINLRLSDAALGRVMGALRSDARLGVPLASPAQRVFVDYCGANVAKQMHVGHLRSLVIGDCFARVLAFLGHDVVRRNHVGDWGLQMGMITHAVQRADVPLEQLTLPLLERLYREASAEVDAGKLGEQLKAVPAHQQAGELTPAQAQAEQARLSGLIAQAPASRKAMAERTRQLQQTPQDQLHAWQAARRLTLDDVHRVMRRLGVLLEEGDVRGESFYSEHYDPMIAELRAAGHAVDTEGAVAVFPAGFKTSEGTPRPFILQSRDGTYQYATFDLAALRHRVGQEGAQRLVYTHDRRQMDHFAMLFKVAQQVGYARPDFPMAYAAFGAVLGEDGKPLKTRSGENVKLDDLLQEAEQRALAVVQEKNPGLPEAVKQEVARAVGIGSLKYADLSSERQKDYVFSWDRMLSFKGNTAPYLQFSRTRAAGVRRKAAELGLPELDADAAVTIVEPAERALAIRLLQLPDAVEHVGQRLEPHRLCGYAYDLAVAFHSFLEQCRVLDAEPAVRDSRRALCELTSAGLSLTLGLLGITALEQM